MNQPLDNLDVEDPLREYRAEFLFPKSPTHGDYIYLAGNSLGLQPKKAREYVNQELDDWGTLGVEGHLRARHAWLPYHELLTPMTARLVGALESEVVVMNSLTVNLHLLMVSFYRPQGERTKILIEAGAFPSDQYAVKSQIAFHGLDPKTELIEVAPRSGADNLRLDDILEAIAKAGSTLALVLIGNVNYRSGQAFDMKEISRAAHKVGARVGFDLAHGAGNLHINLHDDGPDFAAWCSYKYLNAGPGAIAGIFVHDRHRTAKLPRFSGWWGNDKVSRFLMKSDFDCLPGAEGWQLSNPPIFQLAALRASMEIFDRAGMSALRLKADKLTQFLEQLLAGTPGISVVTPTELKERGTQMSLRIKRGGRDVVKALYDRGIICDFREPDILRIAPVPLYTRFADLRRFVEQLKQCL